MAGDPLISVIIPSYNSAHLLPQTLDSVLSQTCPDYEVVVIDDGSTDQTAQLYDRYPAPVRFISQKNAGNAAARNRGITESRGRWLCFLDADDLWLPNKLEYQLQDLSNHPDIRISFPGGERFHDNGQVEQVAAGPRHANDIWSALLQYQPFVSSLSGVMAHRSCFDRAGVFDQQLKLSVDWDMWIRLAVHFRLRWFDEVLVRVRVHPQGANRQTELRLRMYLQCLEKHRNLFCYQLGMTRAWRASYGDKLLRLGRFLLRQQRYEEAGDYLHQALRYGISREKLSVGLENKLRCMGWHHLLERILQYRHAES
ncbi:MAG: hypothetical protein HJJLKODD_02657 [Phycisphaerae bacterium]|nr:hypothetical protein [Phycisphaerae bacterium]